MLQLQQLDHHFYGNTAVKQYFDEDVVSLWSPNQHNYYHALTEGMSRFANFHALLVFADNRKQNSAVVWFLLSRQGCTERSSFATRQGLILLRKKKCIVLLIGMQGRYSYIWEFIDMLQLKFPQDPIVYEAPVHERFVYFASSWRNFMEASLQLQVQEAHAHWMGSTCSGADRFVDHVLGTQG